MEENIAEQKNKSGKLQTIIITAIITAVVMTIIGTILYYTLRPTLYIVFYKTECVEEKIATNYTEEYVCAYVRLESENNHTLDVHDFSILYNAKYEEAVKVEYFNQSIRTTFYTYPNQPILKVYFRVPHSAADGVVFIKYKDTKMRLGEFATER